MDKKERSFLYGYCFMRYWDRPETPPWDDARLQEAVNRGYITQEEMYDIQNGIKE